MRNLLIGYAATAIVFFGMDFTWISLSVNRFYRAHLGDLMSDKPNMVAGGLFYLFYVVGILVFAVLPSVGQASWIRPLLLGGFLGLIAYGTYDMTNLATIRNWSATVTVVDLVWGGFATAVASVAGYFALRAAS